MSLPISVRRNLCPLAFPSAVAVLLLSAAAIFVPVSEVRAEPDPAVLEAQRNRVEVIERVAPSVVAIFGASGNGGGSGVLISPDGYVLTNFHVTSGAGTFMKCGLNDGKLYDAVIVGIDPTGDVAMIKMLGRDDFPYATLGDSDKLQQGDWAYAMGNPFLLATDFRPTVTFGIVSGVHRYQEPAANNFLEYTDCIQIDSSINPGNSGGPLFNAAGELVGINGRGSFEKRGRVNSGAGYAISINQIKYFMDHLKSGRVVDHATLGATVASERDGSVTVGAILEESEAYRRGLRIDDELVSFGGRPVTTVNQFKNILGIYPKGWKLPIVYRSENQKYEIMVRLRALHRKSELTPGKKRPQQPPRIPKKPGEDPDGDKPDGDEPKDGKPVPGHPPIRLGGPKIPEKYKHLYEKKDGFANYYFNELEQKRALRGVSELGDFAAVAGDWVLRGKSHAAGNVNDFELTLDEKFVGLKLGQRAFLQELSKDPADEPQGTGGLLIALQHLKLFLTQGGTPFTEFYYLGSEPLDGLGEQVDVIVAVLTGVESRFYFSQESGRLLGMDTWRTQDVDECVVRFDQWKEVGGVQLPGKTTVSSGAVEFATLELTAADLQGKAAE